MICDIHKQLYSTTITTIQYYSFGSSSALKGEKSICTNHTAPPPPPPSMPPTKCVRDLFFNSRFLAAAFQRQTKFSLFIALASVP